MLPALAACSDYDDVSINIESPADQMHITATSDDIVLLADEANNDAVTFSWGEAADRGPTATITYLYRIGLSDQIGDAKFQEMTEHSITYTVDELNDMLQEWGVSPETTTEVTAEVVAQVNDETKFQKPEVSKVTVLMTGFRPVSRPLWIVNPAVDPEWNKWCNASTDDSMNEIVLGKQYSWTGWFDSKIGVKCVFDKETGFPALNKGEGDADIVIRNDGSTPESLFYVPMDGYYTVTVSTKTMQVNLELCVPWSECYLVGNALPCGWDIGNPVQLFPDSMNPALFTWTGHVSPGEIKGYPRKGDWGADALMTPTNGSDWDGDDTIVLMPGATPDNKWVISREGECRIEMNLNLMKIKFVWL